MYFNNIYRNSKIQNDRFYTDNAIVSTVSNMKKNQILYMLKILCDTPNHKFQIFNLVDESLYLYSKPHRSPAPILSAIDVKKYQPYMPVSNLNFERISSNQYTIKNSYKTYLNDTSCSIPCNVAIINNDKSHYFKPAKLYIHNKSIDYMYYIIFDEDVTKFGEIAEKYYDVHPGRVTFDNENVHSNIFSKHKD